MTVYICCILMYVFNLYIALYDYEAHKHSCIICIPTALVLYKYLLSMQDQGTITI